MPRVVVIGGGISGLAAAYTIVAARSDLDVTVLEASARVGGTQSTELTDDGFLIERGPDSFITDKPWALALAKSLGLESEIISTNAEHRGSYVVSKGRLERVPDGFSLMAPTRALSFLRSPIFSWRGKARVALELALPRGRARDDESLAGFVQRRFGHEAFERLAQPMVAGIYGADPFRLSLRATMPRFLEAERESRSVILNLRAKEKKAKAEHGAGARYGLFASFRRGMQTLPDALEKQLGDRIRTNVRVTSIARNDLGQYALTLASGETLTADAVISALPAPSAAPILRALDARLFSLLGDIEHGSTAMVTFAYRTADVPHPLDAFGFVVPTIERRACLASTWASVKFAGRAPAGMCLLRVFIGGQNADALLAQGDDELIAVAKSELRDLMGIAVTPHLTRVQRWPHAMPQYLIGHLDRVAAVERVMQDHASLALAGNALHGVGIPDAIHAGEMAAERVLDYLPQRASMS